VVKATGEAGFVAFFEERREESTNESKEESQELENYVSGVGKGGEEGRSVAHFWGCVRARWGLGKKHVCAEKKNFREIEGETVAK